MSTTPTRNEASPEAAIPYGMDEDTAVTQDSSGKSEGSKGSSSSRSGDRKQNHRDTFETSSRHSKGSRAVLVSLDDTGSRVSKSVLVPFDTSILEDLDPNNDDSDDEDGDGKGTCTSNYHLFCFCLCDVRKACIIANIAYIFIMIFTIVFTAVADPEKLGIDMDSEQAQEVVDRMSAGAIPRSTVGLLIAPIGALGAYWFNRWMVLTQVLWYTVWMLWGFLGRRAISGIIAAVLIYPNICLLVSLFTGKLTPKNYEKRKQCCPGMESDDDDDDDVGVERHP